MITKMKAGDQVAVENLVREHINRALTNLKKEWKPDATEGRQNDQ
jgi:DNA-binding GntR family transcriptional regulator